MVDSLMENSPIIVSEAAISKLKKLIADEPNPDINFRVYITGGGCSGFSYGFKFDENRNDDDTVIALSDVCVVVDSLSIQYLDGSTLNYQENLMGSRFVLDNPNAETTCGCGSSFSV